MKILKNLFGLMLLAVTLCYTTSCSSEDDPQPNFAAEIAGSYSGWSKGVFGYAPNGIYTDGEKVEVVSNADGTAKVVFTSTRWGTVTFDNANVTDDGGKDYKLTATTKAQLSMGSNHPSTGGGSSDGYVCNLSGTISKDKQTVSLVLDYPAVMQGTKVTFTNGDAPVVVKVASEYEGTTVMSVMGNEQGRITDPVTIAVGKDGQTADITVPKSGMANMELPAITLKGVKVTATGNDTYTLKLEETTMGITVGESEMKLVVSLEGTITGNAASIKYTVTPGAMPMPISYEFTGNKG